MYGVQNINISEIYHEMPLTNEEIKPTITESKESELNKLET